MSMNRTSSPGSPDRAWSQQSWLASLQWVNLSTTTLLVSLVLICIIFAFITPHFFSITNLVNIGQTLAVVGIVAIGETLVLIAGGVDISVGSVAALTAVVASMLWNNDILPIWWCVAAGLLGGVLMGWLNGFIVTRFKINPLITTLAMFSIIRGLAFVLSGGQTNQFQNEQVQFLGRGNIGGIPFSLILMLILYAIFIYILRQTTFGRNLYAIGGSPTASRLAGIAVNRHLLIVYILSGFFASLGGILIASQLASGTPQSAVGLEFTVIAAVILGGTSLAGGKGALMGTLIGVFILRTLDNGLILSGMSSYYQEVARGVVLLLAVGLDQIRIRLGRS